MSEEVPFEVLRARYESDSEEGDQASVGNASHEEMSNWAAMSDDDVSYDSLDDIDVMQASGNSVRFLNGAQRTGPKHMQPLKNALHKLDAHLRMGVVSYTPSEEISDVRVDARVDGHLRETEKKQMKNRMRVTDKSDRATVDSVLDKRTRTILLKMLNRAIFSEIYGVVSTGKEANVYHAVNDAGADLAIKIYKTSILGFRDRERYVSGDYRFRKGYSQSNPRKMVATWAEKEMRNLNRLYNSGILAPRPIEQKLHVLVMEFIGKESVAALRLKDADLGHDQALKAHRDLCLVLWRLYSQCKLVHADFSEYNILYSQGACYVIDVSQSVDLDHPLVLDFLRKDCERLIDFFQEKGIAALTLRELFDFVTDPTVTKENVHTTLDKLLEQADRRLSENVVKEDESEVFKHVFLPRKLEEVVEYERDIESVQQGKSQGIYYQTIMGLTEDLSGVQLVPKIIERTDTSQSESEELSNEEDATNHKQHRTPLSKEEIKARRKENKKTVKEENRERRKSKVPKHVKKQMVKKGKKKH